MPLATLSSRGLSLQLEWNPVLWVMHLGHLLAGCITQLAVSHIWLCLSLVLVRPRQLTRPHVAAGCRDCWCTTCHCLYHL
jgi:uncharacterized protein (DUF2062 family)